MDKVSTEERFISRLVAEAQNDTALLRLRAQLAETGRGRSSTYTDEAAGLLTPAIKLTPRCAVRPRGEIKAITRARIAGLGDEGVRELVRQLVAARQLGRAEAA